MSNHLYTLLTHWYADRNETDWVLGTIFRTCGPSYRKAGAHMLFNGWGQQFGLLSGGCLEADMQQHARRVMQLGQAKTLCYDAEEEDDVAYQLGIGCGGRVEIILHPISRELNFLDFERLHHCAQTGQGCFYHQYIDLNASANSRMLSPEPFSVPVPVSDFAPSVVTHVEQAKKSDLRGAAAQWRPCDGSEEQSNRARDAARRESGWLITPVMPPSHVLVVGGGRDAEPVVSMAATLGWAVDVWDPRAAYARHDRFSDAAHIHRCDIETFRASTVRSYDAAIILSHNITIDADALRLLTTGFYDLRYIALLGPRSRRDRILQAAGIQPSELPCALYGPAGIDIGGRLPESIALSILSECHATLYERSAGSLSAFDFL